jgi:hypothetical protein
VRRIAVLLSLGFLLLSGCVVGVWAYGFPENFYQAFPGCGRVWISVDGFYNEHLVRDVGALNLSIGVLAGFALFRPNMVQPVVVGWATLAYNLPHFLYHLTKLALIQPLDQVLGALALGSALLSSVILIVAGLTRRRDGAV